MAAFCENRENIDLKMWRLRMASSGGFEWLGIERSVGVDGAQEGADMGSLSGMASGNVLAFVSVRSCSR